MKSIVVNFTVLLVGFILCWSVRCQELPCCSLATGSCRSPCSQMSLVTMAVDAQARDQGIRDVRSYCPQQLVEFWQCMNKTMEEIVSGTGWSGRACCPLPQSGQCQLACVRAASRHDVMPSCRQSDETDFFSCLDRQEVGEACCRGAYTDDCRDACLAVFRSELTAPREARDLVDALCTRSPRVAQCVRNHTRMAAIDNTHRYLHCCEKATNFTCRDTCRRTLQTKVIGMEIVDSMQKGGCGPPLPHVPIWQCFLKSPKTPEYDPTDKNVPGMDSVKLHCCSKAVSSQCRRLCLKTYSNEWTRTWVQFDRECLSQPGEDELVHCISEVDEPCELGCDGLSFCTNFNNRPTELFRSCTSQSDDAARYDVAQWTQQRFLSLPGMQLPVRNVSACSPDAWKAVACALQVKPCHKQSHENRICREDCYSLLSRCMDWPRMPPAHTADSLCARLSPGSPDSPCISLGAFLAPSTAPYAATDEVTSPCRGDPCRDGQVCVVQRGCRPGRACRQYTCEPGCKLGEVSKYLVPQGSYVRVPLTPGQKGCFNICQCSAGGVIEQCKSVSCFPLNSCWIGNREIDHGSSFHIECNLCSCYAGELTCSKRHCDEATSIDSGLPCNCPAHYVPVCGRNGITYPSSCLAKCSGLGVTEFEFRPCSEKEACDPNPCESSQTCIPVRQECLSQLHRPCTQYQCVSETEPCLEMALEPVCDTDGKEHPNLCYMLHFGKQLAYRGPCLEGCDATATVCAINGETFSSECATHASHLSVDYFGSCSAVGTIGTGAERRCEVACRPLARAGCLGVTPPGACCPVCAGAVRFLYSQKQIDRARHILRHTSTSALTVSSILSSLERHVRVAECSLRGFLTVELDLFVTVESNVADPSDLQLEACVGEAHKLAGLVRRSSPRVLSELGLSVLTAATVVHVEVTSASAVPALALAAALAWLIAVIAR